MAKIAVVTDSNSGLSQEQAKKLGIYVIPMPFNIDDRTYYDGIDLDEKTFYERQVADADITTSQPAPGYVTDLWDKLLKDYDQILHMPMSSGLSSTCATAKMLAEDYDGRVFVVDNQRISITLLISVLEALELISYGMTADEIKNILEREGKESGIYLMVDTLKYLKKGGRITPAAAALGTLLRLKPVLQIQGDKLDALAKARTVKQAKNIIIEAMQKDMEKRLEDSIHGEKAVIQLAHTQYIEMAIELRSDLEKLFPDQKMPVVALSLSVATHVGPGVFAAGWTRKVPEIMERNPGFYLDK